MREKTQPCLLYSRQLLFRNFRLMMYVAEWNYIHSSVVSIYLSIPVMHITQELSIVVHGAQPRRRAQCKNNATLKHNV